MLNNRTLKDEIREFWGARAATFDDSIGHKVRTEREAEAWQDLFSKLMGTLSGCRVLELASGTGELTRMLNRAGAQVTGIDLTEEMLAISRRKLAEASPAVRFFQGDAENTMEPDNSYDHVICRHLVWTLVDPTAAFADWYRVLKPGGRAVIIDGDWVNKFRGQQIRTALYRFLVQLKGKPPVWAQMKDKHEDIISRVYFSDGLRSERLSGMLAEAGFEERVEVSLNPILAAKRAGAQTVSERLLVSSAGRFAISVRKPG